MRLRAHAVEYAGGAEEDDVGRGGSGCEDAQQEGGEGAKVHKIHTSTRARAHVGARIAWGAGRQRIEGTWLIIRNVEHKLVAVGKGKFAARPASDFDPLLSLASTTERSGRELRGLFLAIVRQVGFEAEVRPCTSITPIVDQPVAMGNDHESGIAANLFQ